VGPASLLGTKDGWQESDFIPCNIFVLKCDIEDVSLHFVMGDAMVLNERMVPEIAMDKIRWKQCKSHLTVWFVWWTMTH
jgi:hypothetical protein